MTTYASLKKRLRHTVRLDRAIRFVWQAGPGWLISSSVFVVLQGVLPLIALYLMKLIVDSVTASISAQDSAAALREVIFYIILAGGVAILQIFLQALSNLIQEGLTLTVSDRMYDVLHAKSTSVDLDYYENPKYFDTLHRAQREGPFRPTQIVNTLLLLSQNSISLLAMAALLISFHWGVTIILLAAATPGIIVRVKYSRKIFQWHRERTPENRKAMYYNWILTGNIHAKEVRLFGIGDEISSQFRNVRHILRQEKLAITRQRAIADFFTQTLGTLAIFAALGAIAYRAVLGLITLGDMVMFFQAFQRGLIFLRNILQNMADLYENNLFLSYLYEFLDVESIVKEPAAPLPVPKHLQHGIAFDRVWFRYPNTDQMILKDITLNIKPGEVVALVGANGSGKTTLVKLLCRLYDPTRGQISLEGVSLDQFNTNALRHEISIIFQDFVQYQLTANDNIRFGNLDLTSTDPASVRHAARNAGADQIIASLPKGYQTILGKLFKDGVELSLGQWQMIAIARAFMRDARLIVLDEPTSSLDPITEYEIFSRFKDMLKNKSAVLISHRFSTVQMADRIVALKNGRIIEQGTHQDLMQKNGYYAHLFEKQSRVLSKPSNMTSS
ncbi:MAG: ABC transporter ATP-binding protein [Desulfobacteraceae bacterium]|nr:ABC transporter ATP-binding protein [Desulfobacteraceae bacterium]MBC2757642.1 ABC transporter ATP-binding protein [Desulfobacteraceae bacterium]MBC2763887.1 ABC transporter ATP-binding protein [ANME-2 cluster archaeon]